jgi:hypothetical protein
MHTSKLQRGFTQQSFGVGFVQEPWKVGGRVTGLASKNGKFIHDGNNGRPRAVLLINPNTTYFPLTKYITRDLASAVVDIPTEKGSQRIIMASAYFPPDERHYPPPELVGLIEYCNIQA